mmetsp:Transcript_18879/g.50771  ORF Transcript_18879/g.50771 Transcript_18879/m.50771 type:complete len:206 (+) Transcript_18879:1722-2339(+)
MDRRTSPSRCCSPCAPCPTYSRCGRATPTRSRAPTAWPWRTARAPRSSRSHARACPTTRAPPSSLSPWARTSFGRRPRRASRCSSASSPRAPRWACVCRSRSSWRRRACAAALCPCPAGSSSTSSLWSTANQFSPRAPRCWLSRRHRVRAGASTRTPWWEWRASARLGQPRTCTRNSASQWTTSLRERAPSWISTARGTWRCPGS